MKDFEALATELRQIRNGLMSLGKRFHDKRSEPNIYTEMLRGNCEHCARHMGEAVDPAVELQINMKHLSRRLPKSSRDALLHEARKQAIVIYDRLDKGLIWMQLCEKNPALGQPDRLIVNEAMAELRSLQARLLTIGSARTIELQLQLKDCKPETSEDDLNEFE